MDFSDALKAVRRGASACRTYWVEHARPGHGVEHMRLLDSVDFTAPVLVIWCQRAGYTPWVPNQSDLLAQDWEITT